MARRQVSLSDFFKDDRKSNRKSGTKSKSSPWHTQSTENQPSKITPSSPFPGHNKQSENAWGQSTVPSQSPIRQAAWGSDMRSQQIESGNWRQPIKEGDDTKRNTRSEKDHEETTIERRRTTSRSSCSPDAYQEDKQQASGARRKAFLSDFVQCGTDSQESRRLNQSYSNRANNNSYQGFSHARPDHSQHPTKQNPPTFHQQNRDSRDFRDIGRARRQHDLTKHQGKGQGFQGPERREDPQSSTSSWSAVNNFTQPNMLKLEGKNPHGNRVDQENQFRDRTRRIADRTGARSSMAHGLKEEVTLDNSKFLQPSVVTSKPECRRVHQDKPVDSHRTSTYLVKPHRMEVTVPLEEMTGFRSGNSIRQSRENRDAKHNYGGKKILDDRNITSMQSTCRLRELLTHDPGDIAAQLLEHDSGFDELLQQHHMSDEIKHLLLQILVKVCQCSMTSEVNSLLVMVWKSTYLTKHLQQLVTSFLNVSKSSFTAISSTLDNILILLNALLQRIPSSCHEVGVLVLLVETIFQQNKKNDNEHCLQEIWTRLQVTKDLYTTLATDEKDRIQQADLRAHYKPPPDDFREIPLLPTAKELRKGQEPFLRRNLTTGKYVDSNHYLDVQYRLLREDFVCPLREGISEYLERQKSSYDPKHRHIEDMRLYTGVHILNPMVGREGIVHTIQFDIRPLSRVRWESTKRLLPGSLVCLTKDNFGTIMFAIVDKRDTKELERGRLTVRFHRLHDVIHAGQDESYLMAETTAYFEQYRPVLLGLQEMGKQNQDTSKLPMEKYIVEASWKVELPSYLADTNKGVYDLRHLTWEDDIDETDTNKDDVGEDDTDEDEAEESSTDEDETEESSTDEDEAEESCTDEGDVQEKLPKAGGDMLKPKKKQDIDALKKSKARWVSLTETGQWPPAETLQFDESQLAAFQAALTREFALIQGPPGTGKTYVGLKIVQTLLFNRHVWSITANAEENIFDARPILVVCYTNHALDQFLEGIFAFEQNIVRIGGGSSSDVLKKLNLNEIRRTKRHFHQRHEDYERVKRILENAEIRINYAKNGIVNRKSLEPFMSRKHFRSFKPYTRHQMEEGVIMLQWLGLVGDQQSDERETTQTRHVIPQVEIPEEDGTIELLGEAELIAQLRQMEEDDPIMRVGRNQRERQIFTTEFAFVLGKGSEEVRLTPEMGDQITQGVMYELSNTPYTFTDEQVSRISDIWSLDQTARWRLYRYWLTKYLNVQMGEMSRWQHTYQTLSQEQKELDLEADEQILKQSKVVGMTTTGAAKNRSLLQRIKPRIIVVEEAAEVLEAHIITTLTRDCQHLILIGDHQQLRPNPTVYRLAKQFKLEVSLFERMINNRIPCQQLRLQHRMRPEISVLMQRHFYKDLEDHQSVLKYENVLGVGCNMFFVQHNETENDVDDMRSKSNTHEVTFLVQFCRYLLLQGYSPSQITILTTYTGQLLNFKRNMDRKTFEGVRVCVVDNYQGEENDIILLSLVRSNDEGNVGFLKVENRICVALSRAKKGLFCIGNLPLLAERSTLWKDVLETLTENKATGRSLPLVCQNHSNVTEASSAMDFMNVADGGCSQPCDYRLSCGHVCDKTCHPLDLDHKESVCSKPCTRKCTRDHPCQLNCVEDCVCFAKVTITMPECSHEQVIPCNKVEDWVCQVQCQKLMACGHSCTNVCGESCLPTSSCREPCQKKCPRNHSCELECRETCKCKEKVEKVMDSCQHIQTVECHRYGTWTCRTPCEKKLTCGHACTKACGEKCLRSVYCEELCPAKCVRDHPGTVTCLGLALGKKPVCKEIVTKTMRDCGHEQKVVCCEYNNIHCKARCEKKLRCGHPCPNQCFENCADNNQYMRKCVEKVEVALPDCNHKVTVLCKDNPVLNDNSDSDTDTDTEDFYMRKMRLLRNLSRTKLIHIYPDCRNKWSRMLSCGHDCPNKCVKPCAAKCKVIAEKSFPCGHTVSGPCSNIDKMTCWGKKCQRTLSCGHACQQRCIDPCHCDIMTMKTLKCGHEMQMNCSTDSDDTMCDALCSKMLLCGHPCTKPCREPCQTYCKQSVVKQVPSCGHDMEVQCGSKVEDIQCTNQCSMKLECKHRCSNKCGESCIIKCQMKVPTELACGHKQSIECWRQGQYVECTSRCTQLLSCGHTCKGECGKPCVTKCDAMEAKTMLECQHSVSIPCWQDVHSVPCSGPCEKQLACGHKCGQKCGDPCEKQCQVKVEKVLKSCNHRQTLSCYVNPEDHVCQVRCKRKLNCGHRCKTCCGEPCDCGVTRKKRMPGCGHIQAVGCQKQVTEHVCQEKCEKKLPCKHICMNKCGEPCGESQCTKGVMKTLPDCKHKHLMPCYMHPRDFKCTSKCKRLLVCGHPCPKTCSEICETTDSSTQQCQLPCMKTMKCGHVCKNKCADLCTEVCQKAVKKSLPGCHHLYIVACAEDVTSIKCSEKCDKELPCGHNCKLTCEEPCRCDEKCNRPLSCGHGCKEPCGRPCTEDCNVKVIKIIDSCGHRMPYETPCHFVPTRVDCKKYCRVLFACGHRCSQQCRLCEGHDLDQQEPRCRDKCNTILRCGHICSALCGECQGRRFHMPCRNRCGRTLLCGCHCRRGCTEYCKCYESDDELEMFFTLRACPLHTTDVARLMSLNRTSIGINMRSLTGNRQGNNCKHQGTTHCTKPCQAKLICGHRCIGLCGEPCIPLCRFCDREKVLAIFPEYTVDADPCYIILIPCGHIFEYQSLRKYPKESGMCKPVRPMTCPKCNTPASNPRFTDMFASWISDVRDVEAIVAQKEREFSEKNTIWVTEVEKLEKSLKVRLTDLSSIAKVYDIESQSNVIQDNVCKIVHEGIKHQVHSSPHLSTQTAADITLELFRLKSVCKILEILRDTASSDEIDQSLPPTLRRVMDLLLPPARLTGDICKNVKKDIDDFRREIDLASEETPGPPISLSCRKLNPPRFIKDEWYKCSSGHYFSKSEAKHKDGTSVKSVTCPVCTEDGSAKAEAATGCADEPVMDS